MIRRLVMVLGGVALVGLAVWLAGHGRIAQAIALGAVLLGIALLIGPLGQKRTNRNR